MAQAIKSFSTKAAAKKALHKVFGVGIYDESGLHASAKFMNGSVEKEGSSFVVKLSSTYWVESSLQRAFKVGVDNL